MSNSPVTSLRDQVIDRSVLLVLSAPSGTGKTTIARRIVDEIPEAAFSISCTTRKPRGSEENSVDYQFVSEHEFTQMLKGDAFAEWAEVHGNFYGTPVSEVDAALSKGKVVVFDIDVQGGEQLKKRYPMAVTVLVLPPSYAELERRLRARGTNEDLDIERRLLAAQSELRRGREYDYCVVNDSLDVAVAEVKALVTAERCRTSRVNFEKSGL